MRELLAAGEAYDGPVPLTAEAWVVQEGQVEEVASWITSAARSVPVLVFAHDSEQAYEQTRLARNLARDLAGVAAVLRLGDGQATERFARSLPGGYAVWGGAMRTYLPGAVSAADDVDARHRILGRTTLSALGARAFPAVKDQVLTYSVRHPTPVVTSAPGRRDAATPSRSAGVAANRPGVLPTVGPGWFKERLRKIRRALGLPSSSGVANRETEVVAAFDRALEQLLDRVSGYDPQPLAPAPSADRTGDVEHLLQELEREREDQETLQSLLEEMQVDLADRSAEERALRGEREELTLEATEATEEADRLQRQVRFLQRQLRALGDPGIGSDDSLPPAPPSVAEVVALAQQHLTYLHLAPSVNQVAAELDLHARAQLFAVKAWSSLSALNAYARARSKSEFEGSFYAWCLEPPTGEPAISANAVALVESETVSNVPSLREARTFPVPGEVEPTGRAYMEAHIKVVKRGSPAPRLHFLDDAAGTGKVYVGYLGEHLPTARFP